jgi:hypothetical protein
MYLTLQTVKDEALDPNRTDEPLFIDSYAMVGKLFQGLTQLLRRTFCLGDPLPFFSKRNCRDALLGEQYFMDHIRLRFLNNLYSVWLGSALNLSNFCLTFYLVKHGKTR